MCCRMVLNSVQGLRPATQGIDMRERPGPVTPPKFGPMQGSPGSAEADERVEGLVDEMQRWAQSGGAEGGGRSGRMEEGTRCATRETSSSHTPKHATQTKHVAIQYGRTPSRTLHARSITFEFTQYDQPTWTILGHVQAHQEGHQTAVPLPRRPQTLPL
jgi:hypothetical protein